MSKITIDGARGTGTKLPVCTCGWRGWPARDSLVAWRQARVHEQEAHPGGIAAARALDAANRRAAS